MPPYRFRIRFLLSADRRLTSELERVTVELQTGIGVVELISRSDSKKISGATEFVLKSAGSSTEADAAAAGQRALEALLLAAAHSHIGIDLGRERPKGHLTEYGKELIAQHVGNDLPIREDHFGLQIYDDPKGTRFAAFDLGRIATGRPLEEFLESLRVASSAVAPLYPRLQLALELYHAGKCESSLRARFLTFVTAIETVADRSRRSDEVQTLIRRWHDDAGALPPPIASQLRSALGDLQSESIGAACAHVVQEHLGSEEEGFFRECYAARSELVHSGRTRFNLAGSTERLDHLVASVVVRLAGIAP